MLGINLGRYRLEKWIGGGRFGDVYYAVDTLIGHPFAVKIIRFDREKFQEIIEEAKTLLLLDHPNIVRFFNVEVVRDKILIVMEFLDGRSLREIIKREAPFVLERVIFYAEQIASAIDYAHSRGIVHRDIKPENIIVLDDGRVKILDFGIAKIHLEGEFGVGGTPAYMAPEAWEGNFSRKSDIWSFAVILVEMLLGKNPFFASSLDEIKEKVRNPSLVKVKLSSFGDKIYSVFEKALSLDPELRHERCIDIVNELKEEEIPTTVILDGSKGYDSSEVLESLELTEEQKRVLVAKDRRILVVGGPGTGKTFLISQKVKDLIDNGVDPSTIFVLTFSAKNARLLEHIISARNERGRNVNVLTFHEFTLGIVKRYGYSIGFDEDSIFLSPLKKTYLEKKLIKQITERLNVPETIAIEIFKRFHRIRNECGDIKRFLENSSGRWNIVLKEFWNLYNNFLKTEGIFDYDDLVYFAVRILSENSLALDDVRSRVKYLLVDDVQDLNWLQWRLLEFFSDAEMFLTCDDDQAIYSWRGATLSILREKVRGFKVYYLTKSFRLFDALVYAVNNLVVRNNSVFPKALWSDKSSDKFYFDVKSFETPQDEAEFICDILEILRIKEGYSYSDFAILYRTNMRGGIIQQKLKSRGIPFSFQHSPSYYSKSEAGLVSDILKYVISESENAKNRVFTHLVKLGLRRRELENNVNFRKFMEDIKLLDKASSVIAKLMELFCGLKFTNVHSLYRRISALENLYFAALDFEKRSKNPTIRSFLNYLKFLVDSGLAGEEEGVKLLSIYSARGMEFPVVFVVGLVEGEFPSVKSLAFPEELEEERRLFYTAVTRAKEKLFLTYYRYLSSYSRVMEKPSRFIREFIGI